MTGLLAEARRALPLGAARAGGGLPRGAEAAAHRLADEGATALISFGLAGGLSADLPAGALIIPAAIVTSGCRSDTDPALNAWLGGCTGHILLGGDAIAATRADKAALHATGVHAIDLESGATMQVALARNLPFAALRVICDPAEADLPPAALAALDGRGAVGLGRVAASLLRHPGQIAALLRLARQARLARATLIRQVARIGASAPA